MATVEFELFGAFESHSVGGIRDILDAGYDIRLPIKGKSAVDSLTEMYTRSDRFADCLRLLLERGAVLADPQIALVLLDDADGLAAALQADRLLISHRTSMVSAFTPLVGASLLHVAAEFGNLNAARVLLDMGAAVDERASFDAYGLNGHTPLFHTVNSNDNRSAPLLQLLLAAGAQPDIRLQGITWGKGFEWETTCFDVTPISYAQMGLLPQMHRRDREIYANITSLLDASGRRIPPLENVPNRYLTSNR